MSSIPPIQPPSPSRRQSPRKALAALSAVALAALAAVAPPAADPVSAAVFAPTAGSPDEFILDLANRGLPFMVGSYSTSLGYQNYKIMNIEGTTTSDADASYPGHDLVVDFQGDASDWWFAPEGYGDQGNDLHGFMYDAGAPAGSKYAYFVFEASPLSNSPSYIGRVDNNGVFSHIAHIDRPSGTSHSDHEWTMLSNGDLILFNSPTGTLQNFGNLRSLSTNYTYSNKHQSPTLTIQSETQPGQELSEADWGPGLLQTAVIDIAGVEHIMVIDADSPPTYGIHLFNASTLAYVGELDPSASTGVEGEGNFWTTTAGPDVEATASIGGDAYLVYSTPDTVSSFSPVAGRYAVGKISGANIDLGAMTVDITSHLTDVEMKNRVSLGIQAPAAMQTLELPPELPAISHLVYDANGGQQNTSPGTQTDAVSTVVSVDSGSPDYTGYNFVGWNSSADGTGTSYGAGDNYTLPGTAGDVDTVFARWAQAPGAASCSSGTGFIQAVKGIVGDDIISFKKLSLDDGDYVEMDPAVSLDLAALGFAGSDGFNATAIDKATGKMFATINNGADLWLVQFDLEPTPNVAFLGKVEHPGTNGGFSGTVTSDGTYVMNYYIDGLVEIPNVSSLTAYGSPEAASGVTLGTVHMTNAFGWHGDLTTITLSDGSEHVVGYNPALSKVVLAPVDDLGNPVAYTTTFPMSTSSDANFGASWSTGDTVYLSRNDGGGVFAVLADDIDTDAQSLTIRATSITSTMPTSSNDGFGCVPAAEAPEVVSPRPPASALSCSAWAGLIWVQNQGDTSTNDYQDANTSQFFLFDPATGALDADGLDDSSTWRYADADLGYNIAINATGVHPETNVMYGTARVGASPNEYVASFAPGEDPVFHAFQRQTATGSVISNIGVGAIDAEGYYWITDGWNSPLYRSQQPLSAFPGFANYSDATEPMVFDAVSPSAFAAVSDIAVIPITDGYLVAGFLFNDLSWGTFNTATGVWTGGETATIATGTGTPGDYGAVFIDGVEQTANGLDYSAASIYFTPNAGWDPSNEANSRRPVKLAVADALDGITADDLTALDAIETPRTSSNDGTSMSGCGLQLPDPLGDLHGWVWQDADDNSVRATVEPADGLFGAEGVVTNYEAAVISENDWSTLQGVVVYPAGTRFPATVDADGRWSVTDLPSGNDPTGNPQTFKVEFDLTNADGWLEGFTPNGFVLAEGAAVAGVSPSGGTSPLDSDVVEQDSLGVIGTSNGGIEVAPNTSTHAADAGVVNTPPPGELDVTWYSQCDASNDGTADIWVTEFVNTHGTDATFNLYFGTTLIDTLVVPAGQTMTGTFWEHSLPYQSPIRFEGVVDSTPEDLSISGNGCEKVSQIIYEEQGGDEVDDDSCMYGTGNFTIPAAPSRDGYTFVGWNSASDGSGTEYVAGQTYDCDDLTIYAIWEQIPAPPVVIYEEQGGDDVADPVCTTGGSFTIPAAPSRDGYTFVGWNSMADGSGTEYVIGQSYDCSDMTIYAIWEQIPAPPVVIFDEQGGTDVTDPVCEVGGSFTVPSAPTRDGYTFAGWNSAADGSGTEYVIDQAYGCDDLVIYAIWTQTPAPVVTFDEQGGNDVADPVCEVGGQFITPEAPSRDGYTFAGWNSMADGSGTEYVIGQSYDCSDRTIYAIWTQAPAPVELPVTGAQTNLLLVIASLLFGTGFGLSAGSRKLKATIRS